MQAYLDLSQNASKKFLMTRNYPMFLNYFLKKIQMCAGRSIAPNYAYVTCSKTSSSPAELKLRRGAQKARGQRAADAAIETLAFMCTGQMARRIATLTCLLVLLSQGFAPQASAASEVYPDASWQFKRPDEVEMDTTELAELEAYMGGRGAVSRYGYMVYTWGDPARRVQIASAGKPVFVHFLFDAVEEGKLASLNTRINTYEPCVNDINADLGYKDRQITFAHMAQQISNYGVTEKPGQAFNYNDWQMTLFWDTLFLKVYGATYATVDAMVLRPQLATVLQMQDDPTFMAFGPKRKPGRMAISVRDHVRFGLLYLRKGRWKDTQVLSSSYVSQATTSPLSNSIPRTQGIEAEMCPGQKSKGSSKRPHNPTDHLGSYSWTWWTNGVDRYGKRHWPDVPQEVYMARGHGSKRGLAIFPKQEVVVAWNNAVLNRTYDRSELNYALKLIYDATR